jgi:hypothetical protein
MTDSWYYFRDGQPVGPVPLGHLIAELRRSPLWHREPVWKTGYSVWQEAGQIDELVSELLRPARDVSSPSHPERRGGDQIPVQVLALIYAGLAVLGVIAALIYRWLF